MIDELSTLGDGEGLIITMPPRHSKSESVKAWLEWNLGQHPEDEAILASYAVDLARRHSRSIRNEIAGTGSGAFQRFFPGVTLAADSAAASDWALAQGGRFKAAGVGVGITGMGARFAVIDDPFKDRKQAESETTRETVWEWFTSAFLTRLTPDARVVATHCIMASMRVLTGEGGWKAVEDVKPGDTVVSLSTDGKGLETAKVTAARMSGVDPTLVIKTDRLSLSVNGRHPFAVLKSTAATGRGNPSEIEWVKAADLKVGDVVLTAKAMPDDHMADNTLPDESIVNAERAWLLGYLLGDGWVTAYKRKNQKGQPTSYAVCVATGKSVTPEKADLPERVIAALSAWSTSRVYETSHGYYRTDWNAGGRLLHEMGYGSGAKNKRIPECVWHWSVDLRRAFLRGFVDADGSKVRLRNSNERYKAASSNLALIHDIHDLALTCGVRPTNVTSEKPKWQQPPGSPEPVLSQIHRVDLAFIPDEAEGRASLGRNEHPAPRHIRYERIRSITPGITAPVYDLTVEGTESFVCEGFIVHNTRWHEDDLVGRIQSRLDAGDTDELGGLRWRVLNLPAFAEDADPLGRPEGEALWPDRYNARRLEGIRDANPYDFAALYQQRPTTRGGTVFLEPRTFDEPNGGRVYLTVDTAASKRETADFSVLTAWSVTGTGTQTEVDTLESVRRRMSITEFGATAKDLQERYGVPLHIEDAGLAKPIIQYLQSIGLTVIPVKVSGDKFTRAQPYAAAWNQGRVRLPASNPPWVSAFKAEHLAFTGTPTDKHDDQVDTGSLLFQIISAPTPTHTTRRTAQFHNGMRR